jgi:hypothetical protein
MNGLRVRTVAYPESQMAVSEVELVVEHKELIISLPANKRDQKSTIRVPHIKLPKVLIRRR